MRSCCPKRVGSSSAVALGSGAVALLAPKCPACIALWLSGLGLGTGLAGEAAPWLRPVTAVMATAAIAYLLVAVVRGRGRGLSG